MIEPKHPETGSWAGLLSGMAAAAEGLTQEMAGMSLAPDTVHDLKAAAALLERAAAREAQRTWTVPEGL